MVGNVEYRKGLKYKEVGRFTEEDRDITIYEVSLPTQDSSSIHQGYRARTTYERQGRTEELEVVVNGPGLSKARRKIRREISLRTHDKRDLGNLT